MRAASSGGKENHHAKTVINYVIQPGTLERLSL